MAWSIERIKKELLLGEASGVALTTEVLVETVNRVAQTLGAGWIESEVSTVRGMAPAMNVIGMGFRLAAIENLAQADKLITNLRRRDQNADAELTAVYLFRSIAPSTELELYPPVGDRQADFRMRQADDRQWTTVEVTQPASSQERQRIEGILRRLTSAFEKMEHSFSLHILFRREPTDSEIEILCDRLPEFCRLPGQPSAQLVPAGLGFLFLNHAEIGKLLLCEVPELADVPMIGVTAFFTSPSGGGPHHQVSVQIPFKDERAEEILRSEARQLPKDEPGLVMINVSTSKKEILVWGSLIERRFQPNIHTRVSGVCLFSGGMVPVGNQFGWLLQTKLLLNQYAKIHLPDWIGETIKIAGENFERTGI